MVKFTLHSVRISLGAVLNVSSVVEAGNFALDCNVKGMFVRRNDYCSAFGIG